MLARFAGVPSGAGDSDRAMGLLETVATRAQGRGAAAHRRRGAAAAWPPPTRIASSTPSAIDELQRARTLYATAGDRSLEARCVMELAAIHRREGKPVEAIALARSAVAAFRNCTTRRAWSTPPKCSST